MSRQESIKVEQSHERIETAKDQELSEQQRIELHLHTEESSDGMIDVKELMERVVEWEQPAITITDHGRIDAFAEAYKVGSKHQIKVIYGLEVDVVDDETLIVTHVQERELIHTEYVVFDVETTGLSAVHDQIIELSAVKLKDGVVQERFVSLINPKRPLPHKITQLTGISDEMLVNAPGYAEVITQFLSFIQGAVLVAHHARFDMGFLQAAVQKVGRSPVQNPVIDTLELARSLYPKMRNYSLKNLCEQLKITLTHHHRAMYDAEATSILFWNMIQKLHREENVTSLTQINNLTKKRDFSRLRPFRTILLATNEIGLSHLYQLVSLSQQMEYKQSPRIPRSLIRKYREGIFIGSSGAKGELFEAALTKIPEEVEMIARFYDYFEIQPVDVNRYLIDKGRIYSVDRLIDANHLLVKLGEKLQKPVVATGNVHYLDKSDANRWERWLSNTSAFWSDVQHKPKVHFRTTDEMLREFQYLGEEKAREVVIQAPKWIADQIQRLNPFAVKGHPFRNDEDRDC